ncbi:MAG: hypothetical protein KGL39_28525 [Patescibacteria group bacterium]|nr:hypothetical protein [Patescibacteria group bacterium]
MAIRNGFLFKCIQAGTSGTTEPNWIDCGVGSTIDDGTCIWLNDGSSLVTYSGGQTIDSLQPAEAGADVTSSHTAADTTKVNGVVSTSISPIAELMPAEAGADVTSTHTSALTASLSNQTQSDLADDGTYQRLMVSAKTNGALLLNNAQFQIGSGNSIPGWYCSSGNAYTNNTNPAPAIGKQYVVLEGLAGHDAKLQSNQYYDCKPGDIVTIGGTINAISGISCVVFVNFLDLNGGYLSAVTFGSTTPSWTTGANTGIAPTGTTSIQIGFYIYASGSSDNFADVNEIWASLNDPRQPNSAKAYINANDTTAGGHQGFTSYTSTVSIAGMVVEGDNLLDGDSVTFPVAFSGAPIILFGDGGLTYNPAWSTVAQYQSFRATLTPAGGPYTGFTASLQLCQAGSSSSAQTVDFSGENATLSVPSGDTIVNGSLTVNGSVTNAATEANEFTVTITDSSHSTVLATFQIGVPGRSSIPYSKIVTDAAAVNGTVIQVTPAGATTVNYSTYIAPASTSATPTGVPGVSWAAIATS